MPHGHRFAKRRTDPVLGDCCSRRAAADAAWRHLSMELGVDGTGHGRAARLLECPGSARPAGGGGRSARRVVAAFAVRGLHPVGGAADLGMDAGPVAPSAVGIDRRGAASRPDGAISLNPFRGASGLARLLAYGGIFWISLQYCRRAARARQVLAIVTYAGFAYALYGLLVYLTGSETLLFFHRPANLGDLTSSFVNRNSYATYAGLGLLCATGMILVLVTQGIATGSSGRERLLNFVDVAIGRGWPLLLSWVVLLVALVLTHSRSGFLSTAAGLLVLLLAAACSRSAGRRLVLVFAAVLVAGRNRCAAGRRPVAAAAQAGGMAGAGRAAGGLRPNDGGDRRCRRTRHRLRHLRGSLPLLPNQRHRQQLQHGAQHLPGEHPGTGMAGGDGPVRVSPLSSSPARWVSSGGGAMPSIRRSDWRRRCWSRCTLPSISACRSRPLPPPTC